MKRKFLFSLMIIALALPVQAQQQPTEGPSDEEAIKQANNPLASIKTVNLHNYYAPTLYGTPEASMNTAWLRYAQPIGNFIIRASLPIMTIAKDGASPQSGLYDLNAFVIYKFNTGNEGIDLGVGPALTFPTGTNELGSGKWQVGLSAIAFFKNSPVFQFGSLLTWQISYAGNQDKADVNMLTPQLFAMWQLGGGTYLRSTGVWTFDLNSGSYNIPIGLGIGKVIKMGRTVFNIFIEPQYSVFAYGAGQPQFQVFAGFNTQLH